MNSKSNWLLIVTIVMTLTMLFVCLFVMCISIHEMIFFPPRFCLSLSKQQHLVCCVSVCVAHCCILASCSVGGLFLDPIMLRYCLDRLLTLSMIIFGTVHQVILLALNLTFKFFISPLVIWLYKLTYMSFLNKQSVSSQKGSGLQKRFCCGYGAMFLYVPTLKFLVRC